jgi:hypothetical protein
MCQPLCRFRPWECTAIGCSLITVPGILIALYGVVLVIYVSRHMYANFLAALAGLVGPSPAQHEDYAGGFCIPPSSCTWHHFHIQCCQRPSLCCAARCNQGNGCAFIVASGRPLSAMAVAHGILIARCTRPQGTDAVVVLAALN